MELMYFLGQLESCLLQPDMDVSVMKFSCCVENIAFIAVSVSMAEQFEQLEFTYESIKPSDDFACLGKFATSHGKTYLSQEWINYISHVGKEFPSGANEFKQRLMRYAIEGFQVPYDMWDETKRAHPTFSTPNPLRRYLNYKTNPNSIIFSLPSIIFLSCSLSSSLQSGIASLRLQVPGFDFALLSLTYKLQSDRPSQMIARNQDGDVLKSVRALDETYIWVIVPEVDRPRYRIRKGHIAYAHMISNSYVLFDWEGSATDSRIFGDIVTGANGLRVLTDVLYTICKSGETISVHLRIMKNILIRNTYMMGMSLRDVLASSKDVGLSCGVFSTIQSGFRDK
ncbi:hypothetical protein DVH24_000220 [Malus domestica]|uniref:Uncharacterized protein n=1 Tax=Malus domestica TaxID=3750 RepID=A0A498J579_MALDO|nr:hypothetical protein DVH24_000220 [Malus domestica]